VGLFYGLMCSFSVIWLGINLTSQLAMHFTVCSSVSTFFREEALASGMMIIDCGPSATLNEQSKVID
jgi:hypothetical protein